MKEWIAVLQAADAAARWHVHQRRKGAAKEPYVNHLLEVAMLVAEATVGKDPNLVIAALLHDAIEDCEVPPELIADIFGTDVAEPCRRSDRGQEPAERGAQEDSGGARPQEIRARKDPQACRQDQQLAYPGDEPGGGLVRGAQDRVHRMGPQDG